MSRRPAVFVGVNRQAQAEPARRRPRRLGLEDLETRRLLTLAFTVEPPLNSSNSVYPKFIHGADFDGDGDADIVVASLGDDKIAWYENEDGQGTYGPQRVITTLALGAASVRTADLDGDGDADVLSVSSDYYDSDISWYENLDGRGNFSEQKIISADVSGPDSVFAADLDGDSDLDVLSASRVDGKVAWYENTDGQGTFGAQQLISDSSDGATTVFAADLDGDGDPDVIAGSVNDDTVAWYENLDGRGEFGDAQILSDTATHVTAVFAADLDVDGDQDVVVTSRNRNTLAWFANTDGKGQFGPERIISVDEFGPNELFVADLDGDVDPDVVVASRFGDQIAWYENTGRGIFAETRVVTDQANGASAVYPVDVDGDGDLDLFSTSRFDNKVALYKNLDGRGNFGPSLVLTEIGAPNPRNVRTADLDGDGDLDVLSAAHDEDTLAWYENLDGQGTFGGQRVISVRANGVEAVFAADLDGDGDLDVLSASYFDNRIAWYENRDGQGDFGPQQVVTDQASSAESVMAADLDGDGDLDLVTASRYDDKVAWHENTDGRGSFGPQQVVSTTQSGPTIVQAVDLDGDGDLDLLANGYNPDTSSISWYENTDGQGTFSDELQISRAVNVATSVTAADLDGDGDLDVISTSGLDDKVAWYENTDGQGEFGPQQVVATDIDGAFAVQAVDLDRDGDIDLLVAALLADKIVWYENRDGRGDFGGEQAIATEVDGPTSIATGDLDGDGKPDIVASLSNLDQVVWYRNQGDVGPAPGDFNDDGEIDTDDITLLCQEIAAGGLNQALDVTGDQAVNRADLNELITNILGTTFGDANLDGVFNSRDFVQVFQTGEYEDDAADNSTWSEGDWNCDGEFDTRDLVVAFQSGGFVRAAHQK